MQETPQQYIERMLGLVGSKEQRPRTSLSAILDGSSDRRSLKRSSP
jgi:hypothetical protein